MGRIAGRRMSMDGRRSSDMRPRLSKNHAADARLIHAELLSELDLRPPGFIQSTYSSHLRVIEDGSSVAAARDIEQPGATSVQNVVGVHDVLEIVGAVVQFISVLVVHAVIVLTAADWSGRWFQEGSRHNRVNRNPGRYTFMNERRALVSACIFAGEEHPAFYSQRLSIFARDRSRKGIDAAVRGNLVKAFKAADWFPCFAHASDYTADCLNSEA